MGTPNDCAQTQDNGAVPFLPCKAAQWKVRLISGKPDTSRGVRPVWRGAFGNLPQKCGKAPGAYPTVHRSGTPSSFNLCRRKHPERGHFFSEKLCGCMPGRGCNRIGLHHLCRLCEHAVGRRWRSHHNGLELSSRNCF